MNLFFELKNIGIGNIRNKIAIQLILAQKVIVQKTEDAFVSRFDQPCFAEWMAIINGKIAQVGVYKIVVFFAKKASDFRSLLGQRLGNNVGIFAGKVRG